MSDEPTNPPKDYPTALVLELALHEEEQLATRANWLDAKSGAVLGFVIVSVAELLGFLLLASKEPEKFNTSHPCSRSERVCEAKALSSNLSIY